LSTRRGGGAAKRIAWSCIILRAFAQGGEHHSSNLALRCRAHNALAAEEDFGRDFVEKKRVGMSRLALGESEAGALCHRAG
jgi:hypothetical protein